jgi:hypothetical protein
MVTPLLYKMSVDAFGALLFFSADYEEWRLIGLELLEAVIVRVEIWLVESVASLGD